MSVAMRTLLLVDDERLLRQVTSLALRNSFNVLHAASGRDAIEIATDERPDVILLDVMMSGMDGFQTLRILQSQLITSNIPVIFLTAKIFDEDIKMYLATGAAGVICKPFDPLRLPKQIEAVLSGTSAPFVVAG